MLDTIELIKLAQAGDKNAKEQIVENNIGLVWSIVKKFANRGYEKDDLFQIGSIGLIKCIEKFDTSFDVKFSTYAVPMIIGEIKRFLRDDGIIKISRPLKEIAIKVKYTQEAFEKRTGQKPSINEISNELNISVEDILMALEADHDVESLYQTTSQDSNDYLIDKIKCDEQNSTKFIDILAIRQIINKLQEKEKKIIIMRYFEDKTQTEISKIIGISQVQVSRIEKKVIDMIKKNL